MFRIGFDQPPADIYFLCRYSGNRLESRQLILIGVHSSTSRPASFYTGLWGYQLHPHAAATLTRRATTRSFTARERETRLPRSRYPTSAGANQSQDSSQPHDPPAGTWTQTFKGQLLTRPLAESHPENSEGLRPRRLSHGAIHRGK